MGEFDVKWIKIERNKSLKDFLGENKNSRGTRGNSSIILLFSFKSIKY